MKRCPFCKGEAELVHIPPFVHPKSGRKGIERWQVVCHGCGVVTAAFLSPEDAEKAWERREV